MEYAKDAQELKTLLDTKQYTLLRQYLTEINEVDVADWMQALEETDMLKMFRILPKDLAADIFSYMDVDNQQLIIASLSVKEAANIIDNLMADDAVDLLEEMPANVVKRLLANTKADVRDDINHLLRYPEHSAGSIMTVEYMDFKESLTVAQAIERIRRVGMDSETINICYVLDAQRKLLGAVALRYLLLSDEQERIGDIMHENVIAIRTTTDQEEVARNFQKYDFTAMPVVDNEERLVGIITVDDIVEILKEETTEDMEKMAAIVPSDKPYMKSSIWEIFKKRIPWLLLLMISATFTGQIISAYEEALSAYVILTAFIPMLMNTGGNAGGQTSVTIIRGLSLGEIGYRDILRILGRECILGLTCGLTLALANFAKLMVFDHVGLLVAMVVCATLVVAVIMAVLIGCLLPMVTKKLGFDPAVMASPFLSTILDALSLVVYFQIATLVLRL
ncbi:MAG: magnesium transporter [Clostridium sp.]|jgi:magnesium transporter|nr:magnesium transporter [Clostridium sp.]